MTNSESVRDAALEAYADVHSDDGMRRRNLNWRALTSVSRDEAIQIMKKACPAYNEFEPALLKKLPADVQIFLAREGSVCIYVSHTGTASREALKADEWHTSSNLIRIWWD